LPKLPLQASFEVRPWVSHALKSRGAKRSSPCNASRRAPLILSAGRAGTSLRDTCRVGAGRRRPKRLVSIRVYLEVTLVNGQNYSIPVEKGHSVEQELALFLEREGRYATDWVPLMKAGRELFVRYEQIVLVSPMG